MYVCVCVCVCVCLCVCRSVCVCVCACVFCSFGERKRPLAKTRCCKNLFLGGKYLQLLCMRRRIHRDATQASLFLLIMVRHLIAFGKCWGGKTFRQRDGWWRREGGRERERERERELDFSRIVV